MMKLILCRFICVVNNGPNTLLKTEVYFTFITVSNEVIGALLSCCITSHVTEQLLTSEW